MVPTSIETLHLIHPKPVAWNAMMEPLANSLTVPLVPYTEWLGRLEFTASEGYKGPRPAAMRILQLYRRGGKFGSDSESLGLLPRVDSAKGIASSTTLSNPALPSLSAQDVEKWVAYWRSINFI
jgi:hypothetical protein